MTVKKAFFFFVLATGLHCFTIFTASAQLRIVCIGNSITQGKTGLKAGSSYEYSYRPWLWQKLIGAGFKVDMVGFHPYFFDEREGHLEMDFKAQGLPFDRDCEAYYGITSDGFVNGSESKGWTGEPLPKFSDRINHTERGYTPDIALIHVGTNDKDSTEAQVLDTRKNIGEIIRVLRAKNPAVVVMLAKLVTGWKKINAQVDEMCREWHTTRSPVVPVDMTTGFINDPKVKGTMTYDYVHPNKAGQLFMMERWYDAILQNLQDSEPPLLKGRPVVVQHSGSSATVSWRVADDNYGIRSYVIKLNGKLIATVSQNNKTYQLRGLRRGRKYKVSISAKDWRENTSTESATTFRLAKTVTKSSLKNR